jgi:hypothetical protein
MLVSKIQTYLSDKMYLKKHDLLQKIFLGPLLQDEENFGGNSSKIMGAKKLFSMLVQDSLPIKTTIAKC